MSLGIAFKGPEGIVLVGQILRMAPLHGRRGQACLTRGRRKRRPYGRPHRMPMFVLNDPLAADSRVTLMAELRQPNLPNPMLLPATYDNATKLLRVKGQDFVGTVTYGAGAIGRTEPRTAHSYIPEFEQELSHHTNGRIPVHPTKGNNWREGNIFMTETMTTSVSTSDWLRATRDMKIWGYVEAQAHAVAGEGSDRTKEAFEEALRRLSQRRSPPYEPDPQSSQT